MADDYCKKTPSIFLLTGSFVFSTRTKDNNYNNNFQFFPIHRWTIDVGSGSYIAEFWRKIGFSQPAHEAFIFNWYAKIQTIWPTECDDGVQIHTIWPSGVHTVDPGPSPDESKMSEAGRKKRREARELINGTGSRFGVRAGTIILMLFGTIRPSCSSDHDVLPISHPVEES